MLTYFWHGLCCRGAGPGRVSIKQPSPGTLQVVTRCPGKASFPEDRLRLGCALGSPGSMPNACALSLMSLVSVLLRWVSCRAGADPSGSHSEEGGSADCEAAVPVDTAWVGRYVGSQGHRGRILPGGPPHHPHPFLLQLHWPPGAAPAQTQLWPTCSRSHRCQGRDVGL